MRAIQDLVSKMDPSRYTCELPDEIIAAMVELEAVDDDSSPGR